MGQVCIPSTSDSKPGNNMPQHCSLLKGEGKIDPLSRTLCFWETSSSCPSWCKKSQAHCTPISLNILSTSEGCGNGWKIPVRFKAPGLWSVADGIKNTFGGQILGKKKPQQGPNNYFPFLLGFIIFGAKCTQQDINLGPVDAKWCEFSHWNNSSKVLPHSTAFRGG